MAPYQIQESTFSSLNPKIPLIKPRKEIEAEIEDICLKWNQLLLLGGRQSESFSAYTMNNYDPLKRVAKEVAMMSNKNSKKIHRTTSKSNKREVTSDSNDETTDEDTYSPPVDVQPVRRPSSRKIPIEQPGREYEDQEQNVIPVQVKSPRQTQMLEKDTRTNQKKKFVRFDNNFDALDHEALVKWLISKNYETAAANLPAYINSGLELRSLSDQVWEKEIGINNELERRRLRLHIMKIVNNDNDKSEKLTFEWVSQWLEDIGLSQYKYEFVKRKVDGTMLKNLTFREVRLLGIYNPLHQCSLKRSIQLLKNQEFHPCYLKAHANINNRKHIAFWTLSDVAEWFRSIGMTKKIKYLKNSGINGALMILEPIFNANTFIDALQIKSKRHKKKMKNELDKLLPYLILQEKEANMKSNNYMPIIKNFAEQKKYNELYSTLEADENPLCPSNSEINSRYKIPPPLEKCPLHESSKNVPIAVPKQTNTTSYI